MNLYEDNSHIATRDLMFLGVLQDIKKSKVALQPIFEAFTNAIEAIKIRSNTGGRIEIDIKAVETTVESTEFNSLTITDNGIGFNDKEFQRFNTFKDFTKGFKNLGSGRIQYAHYFDGTIVKSVFEDSGKYYEREFIVSKKEDYLKHNAIVFHRSCKDSEKTETGTSLTFTSLLENSGIYNGLNSETLKEYLIERYIHYFCFNQNSLPEIIIRFYVQSVLKSQTTISASDIPNIDKEETIQLPYSKVSTNGRSIEKTDKTEPFKIDAFKIRKDILKANKLKFVSKGEIVEDSKISLNGLADSDNINGFKYLFLISGNYIDERDSNLRGELTIPDAESFSKNISLFTNEEILLDDIEAGVNAKIDSMYPEITEVKNKHNEDFDKLKEMFLLDDETAQAINISVNDSETKILEKFYEAEAKKAANIDASIKESIDKLDHLDTTSEKYNEDLQSEIEKLVRFIPLQNKTSLTHYVARRKLVLELFDKILQKQLKVQSDASRNIDEKLLHNLIFQQATSKSEDSDLWLINEDFIYFNGTSEDQLKDIKIGNENLLRDDLSAEEEEFRTSLKENRFAKRPDILLFPDEGKCIIIEFKNPDVNVSDHLAQINNYASLIWNFAKPEYQFHTFFGYLIGEKINPIDVRSHDGDYKEAYNFDYLFRPHKGIPGFFDKKGNDASLYTEVIKYSTLMERAKTRNDIFIKKLTK